ncbi:MAG: hypothetical protein AUJ21_02190 [Anaerolineae bacterium CG1_02_58_13]|nr:MAG: hypothetical protein AUJ21_02190 [Anaerolineae bacterium CG1_02_58_13]
MFATVVMIGITFERVITGAVLLVAGIAKLRIGRNRFLEAILGYDLIPESVAVILARCLPWLEVLSGFLLIVGLLSREAALLAFGLFLVFTMAITISLARGKDNNCGCFENTVSVQWRLVYRDVLLMGLLLPVYAFRGGAITIDELVISSRRSIALPYSNGIILLLFTWGIVLIAIFVIRGLIRKRIIRVGNSQS